MVGDDDEKIAGVEVDLPSQSVPAFFGCELLLKSCKQKREENGADSLMRYNTHPSSGRGMGGREGRADLEKCVTYELRREDRGCGVCCVQR